MQLKKSLLVAIVVCLSAITIWELYWRSQGIETTFPDDKALWATQRGKVDSATKEDVVLFGSSRVLFDFQLNTWKQQTGVFPIQLASAGASPLPSFRDMVEKTSFSGTAIVGVTPGLFFSTTYPKAMPIDRIQSRVNYFYNRTYAQRLNHFFSIPLQKSFVFLRNDEEDWADDLNLKSLISTIKIGNRTNNTMPPFYRFSNITLNRNVTMTDKTVKDTALANSIIEVWKFFGSTSPPPEKIATMDYFIEDAQNFISRGGNLILVRCPSTIGVRAGENMGLPRDLYWDELVSTLKVKSYHFEDYEQLKKFECPEWSHLSKEDAELFTEELVNIMIADNAISQSKTP